MSMGFRRWWPLAVTAPMVLVGCAVVASLPGMDRLISRDSSAEVGPLVTQDGDQPVLPAETQPAAASAQELATEPVAEPPAVAQTTPQSPPESPPQTTPQSPSPPITLAPKASVPAPQSPAMVATDKAITAKTATDNKTDPATTPTSASAPMPPPVATGELSGRVTLMAKGGGPLTAEGTLVRLVPVGQAAPVPAAPAVHEIDMENKIYQPGVLTINRADRVVFVNKDKIRHNVFSSSGKNAFDLGTYGAGLKRSVSLKEPGIIKVYCNIHAEMATFIAVGDPGLTAAVAPSGDFRLPAVPAGRYQLHVWNLRGELWRDVQIQAGGKQRLTLAVDATQAKPEAHSNKFGKQYPANAALFEDEFY